MVDTNESTNALDLGLTPRDQIRIDGVSYDLTPLTGLSIRQRKQMQRHVLRIEAIEKMDDPSEADDREYEDRMRAIAALAIPAAADVLEKLELGQLMAVATAFFVEGANNNLYRAMARAERMTKPSLSQTLPASTAPVNGS